MVRNGFYLINGYLADSSPRADLTAVDFLDLSTGRWRRVTPSLRVAHAGAGAAMDGMVYYFGGLYGTDSSRYNALTGGWSNLGAAAPGQIHGAVAQAVPSSGLIYLFGGAIQSGGTKWVDSIMRFDASTFAWKMLPSSSRLSEGKYLAGTALLSGEQHIIIAGGRTTAQNAGATQSVDMLDLETETTRSLAPLNHSRAGPSLVALNSSAVLALGGTGPGGDPELVMEIYRMDEDRWIDVGSLPSSLTVGAVSSHFRASALFYEGDLVVVTHSPGNVYVLDTLTWEAQLRFEIDAGAVQPVVAQSRAAVVNLP